MVTGYVVGRVEDLPVGSCRIIDVGRWGVGVFNCEGEFFALNNYCPHAGGPVCRGEITGLAVARGGYEVEWVKAGEVIRCPWHGWEFEIATGETVTRPVRRVKTYPVRVVDGVVLVDTDKNEVATGPRPHIGLGSSGSQE